MSWAGLQLAWAELLLAALERAGVRDIVISPGSRSTPLVLAASRLPSLRMHVVLDERSAAFFALGQARQSGRPSLVVCTSGTAGAHYLPAIVEAAEARIPLLALTADRPPELRGRGAPQTIDQTRLFAHHARRFVDLGGPDADPRALQGLAVTAARSVADTLWPDPGPVHLDAWFRKPFEPAPGDVADDALREAARLALASAIEAPPPLSLPDLDAIEPWIATARSARRPLLVLGPDVPWRAIPPARVFEIAARATLVVAAESGSQARFAQGRPAGFADAFEVLARSPRFRARHPPDLVVQVGPTPVSSALETWLLERPETPLLALAPHGFPDAANRARAVLRGDALALLEALFAETPAADLARDREAWRSAWDAANASAWPALSSRSAAEALDEATALATVVDALPPSSTLMLGNSLPVREADLFAPARAGGVRVLTQRGANGIDGLVAGAAGAASVDDEPLTLVLGDVSFVHDLTSLVAARDLGRALAIVVLDNGGGRIFDALPVRQSPEAAALYERCFLTPPRIDAVAAARAFGVMAHGIHTPAELREALARAWTHRGPTVLVAHVAKSAPLAPLHAAVRALDERDA